MKLNYGKALRMIVTGFAFLIALQGYAQDNQNQPKAKKNKTILKHKRNYLKVNLTSLALNNYAIQYERVLSKRTSFAIGGRYMPKSPVPFKSFITEKFIKDDEEIAKMVDGMGLSNYSITPELKFSMGKGYGQGFYISLFYRYNNFDLTGVPVDFDSDGGVQKTLDMSGNLISHTGGVLFGVQKNLSKLLALDIWLLGPHLGNGSGKLTGKPSAPFTSFEQQSIREALEDIDLPYVKTSIGVNANQADYSIDGPWGGLRAGISLGIRF